MCILWYFLICGCVISGDVARVNGQLAVSRAFGDKNLKSHLRSDPDIRHDEIDSDTEFLILASDGLWKVYPWIQLSVHYFLQIFILHWNSTHWFIPFQVMANQEAVDIAKKIKDPQKAAKQLTAEALNRESKDDISCIVVRFKWLWYREHKVFNLWLLPI